MIEGDPRHLVVMGVSGSGKSTIAALLASRLQWVFADGDAFHPPHNVAKLSRAEPLTDADRAPWLAALAEWLRGQHELGRNTVLACSALKRRYRDVLRAAAPQVAFVHLDTPQLVLAERLRHRSGHFMPPELLASQLATLEPLGADEPGLVVDGAAPAASIVDSVLAQLAPHAEQPRG